MLSFIVIDKKQARKKRKQDKFPEKDVLHDKKVSSATKSLFVAKKSGKKKANSKKPSKKTTGA